ncbi:hypothetical protein LINGRAHAP2_LOCUS5108 [Linum grandiflorum]
MPSSEDDSPDIQESVSPFVIHHLKGRDKQKKKKRGPPKVGMEAWQKTMTDLVRNSNTYAQLGVGRDKRKNAREARENASEDERILNMDLSQYDPQTQAWYQAQKMLS